MSPRPYPGRYPNPWHPTAVGPGPPPPAEGPCSQAVLRTHGWRLGAPRASAPFFPTDAPQPRGHRRCCPPQCPPLTSSVVSGMQMRYSLMSMVAGVRPRCGHWRGHSSFWGEPGDTVRAGGTGLAAASPTPSPSPHARGGRPVPSAGDFMSRCYGSSMRSLVRGAAWVYPAEDTPVPKNHPGINPFPARQTLTPLVSKHVSPQNTMSPLQGATSTPGPSIQHSERVVWTPGRDEKLSLGTYALACPGQLLPGSIQVVFLVWDSSSLGRSWSLHPRAAPSTHPDQPPPQGCPPSTHPS